MRFFPTLFSQRLIGVVTVLAACSLVVPSSADEPRRDAKPADKPVDFADDVAPIFQKRCAKCHTGTQKKGGLSLNTRQTLLTGGDSGPAVVPKKSAESELIERVTSTEADARMPPEGERLTDVQVELLKRWIDADLPWEDGFAFGKATRQAPLAPRRPAVPNVPDDARLTNPIDRFLYGYFAKHNVTVRVDDSDDVFARRASFDLIGLPPTPKDAEELRTAARPSTDRLKYIQRLLADREAYAAHWLTFWNDLLRNAYHGTGFIDGGRKQITGWLYAALHENVPYDRFAHDLVSPKPASGSEGFTFGIKWRGTVNESQRREIQAAQSVGQVFLGTNLKCASCHDSFVNHWKLTDAYALASVFADGKLELHRCDQPEGIPATVGFLYPELGTIDPQASREGRMRQLADLLVHEQNGRFARTIVNRLWAKLFGRGLVEPLDNMDAEPWHQDLLDYLASDLADHGYDLKRTLTLMATSHAYQMPGVGFDNTAAGGDEFVFRGPFVKRLTAEQFVDTVFTLTSTWPEPDAGLLKSDGRAQGGQLGAIAQTLAGDSSSSPAGERRLLAQAHWVWSRRDARQAAPPQTIFLRRVWPLEARPARAIATFTADNSCELFVNGKSVGKLDNWAMPFQVDVADALIAGKNVLAIKAANGGSSPNPAGVIGEVVALGADGKHVGLLSTDESWRVSEVEAAGWQKAEFSDSAWTAAAVLGDASVDPWQIEKSVAQGNLNSQVSAPLPAEFRIRAALLPLDSLQAALGRPNREQVVSSRDTSPTMLQALELTNGTQLGQAIQRGAAAWHRQQGKTTPQIVDEVYQIALGRSPSNGERQVSSEIVGSPAAQEGLEDFLWSICMLPEFQLVP
jgi:mono/diheme cytochrome c family protein